MSGPCERHRLIFTFRICGDVKFISHHDTLRMFRRALARSELPISYTEGFNPHPKLSLPVPRPVGLSSEDESLIVELEQPVDPREALKRLGSQMPAGVELLAAREARPGESLRPARVRYRLDAGQPTDELRERVEQLAIAPAALVDRKDPKGGRTKTIDVKRFLERVEWVDDEIEFVLRIGDDGAAKPSELAATLGFDPDSIMHRIRRMEVQWHSTT